MSRDARDLLQDSRVETRRRSGTGRGCGRVFIIGLYLLLVLPLSVVLLDISGAGTRLKEFVQSLREPRVVEKIVIQEKIVEKVVEAPAKQGPLPSRHVFTKTIDTGTLYREFGIQSDLNPVEGKRASEDRKQEESMLINLSLTVKMPAPARTLAELSTLNADLPKILPGLEPMLAGAQVSPFFYQIYELKKRELQSKLTRLDRLLSQHNFYDCETVLELSHPEKGGTALLLQGEMDVVSDGSDGDRWPDMQDFITLSDNYQPFTNYAWPKKTRQPNPLLARWEARLKKSEEEFAIPGLSIERNRSLRAEIDRLKPGVTDMKYRSYLIAEADPFMVVPLSMLNRKSETPFGPAIGDFAVVIHGGKLLPAIVGDAGPAYKMGEASLRIARELSEKATPYNRPVSDLTVTYLVFPNSADAKADAPDLARWRTRCQELLDGIGGVGDGYALHTWDDIIAKRHAEAEAKKAAGNPPAPPSAPSPPAGEEPPEPPLAPDAEASPPADPPALPKSPAPEPAASSQP